MGARARLGRFVAFALLVAPAVLVLAACSTGDPLDTLTGRGDVSEKIRRIFYIPFWIAVVIFFVVEGLLLFCLIRFRERRDAEEMPKQTHGNTRLEVGWTILPSLVLAVVAVPTIAGIVELAETPDNPQRVQVIAHQWWWEFRYTTPDGRQVVTANEMYIPVGRRVLATVESADVIHSFWVPNLAGKQDVVPGHQNHIWFNAKTPGRYEGQCAEFCGESHALMRFLVYAVPQDQFDQWLRALAQPVRPTAPSAQRGRELFLANACIACHTIAGEERATGVTGPNLSRFGARTTLAANRLQNTPENTFKWITNPQAVKPGALMPARGGATPEQLSDDDVRAIVDYLESLR
jgi:cytochrome c oxidase subunit 2